MGKRRPTDITFAELERLAGDPDRCRAFVEKLRFPQGLVCPFCDAREADRPFVRHRSRPGLFTCGACRRQFSLTSGTALHRTKLPLGQWVRAIWLVISSSKGISARKLSEMIGVTYKVAWHMGHRIRSMMAVGQTVLSGVVEIDEVYAGAPPRKPHGGGSSGVPSGRGPRRPLVLTMVERGGEAIMKTIASYSTAAIGKVAADHLDPSAVIATDALPAYQRVAAGHAHLTITHSAGQYVVRDPAGIGVDAHTNTAEAIHANLRRAVMGVWHWVSQKHLDRYLDEVTWRHNRQKLGHLTRMALVFQRKAGPLPLGELASASP